MRVIQNAELSKQHTDGPTVSNNVMQQQEQDMLAPIEAKERCLEQGPFDEIEGAETKLIS